MTCFMPNMGTDHGEPFDKANTRLKQELTEIKLQIAEACYKLGRSGWSGAPEIVQILAEKGGVMERQDENPKFSEVYQSLCAQHVTSELAYWLTILWQQVQDLKKEVRILRGEGA